MSKNFIDEDEQATVKTEALEPPKDAEAAPREPTIAEVAEELEDAERRLRVAESNKKSADLAFTSATQGLAKAQKKFDEAVNKKRSSGPWAGLVNLEDTF